MSLVAQVLHDPTHTTGVGHDLHRRGPRIGPDLTQVRAHTSAPYGLLVPHDQTPDSLVPTKLTHHHPQPAKALRVRSDFALQKRETAHLQQE